MYDVLNAYLENGLKIILHKIPNVRTISCGLWVNHGSKYETDADNGLSHLAEHLLLNPKNKKNPMYEELESRVSSKGVIYNASTTKEYTSFYYTGLENTLDDCLSCLASIAMKNREFSDDFFENEKR